MSATLPTTAAKPPSGERDRIRSLGQEMSMAIADEMRDTFAALQRGPGPAVRIERDLAYGDHPRHRLNLFAPRGANGASGILVFVHGGGFISGDKDDVPGAFYDNVGLWAVSQNLIGVPMNYRLAPDHTWPAGSEDVSAAVEWLHANAGEYGGDPGRIIVMGHSAGAGLVAGYAAEGRHRGRHAALICVSGVYDLRLPRVSPAYYGADTSLYPSRSPLDGLADSDAPLLLACGEYDPTFVQQHMASAASAKLAAKGVLPSLARINDHNHYSVLFHLNTEDASLARALETFIASL